MDAYFRKPVGRVQKMCVAKLWPMIGKMIPLVCLALIMGCGGGKPVPLGEAISPVDEQGYVAALKKKHTREMDFTGNPLKSMIYVSASGIKTDASLCKWMLEGLSLPGRYRRSDHFFLFFFFFFMSPGFFLRLRP